MSRQTVEFSITAAERLNETLNAFLEIDREGALAHVTEIEQRGNAGALAGDSGRRQRQHVRQGTSGFLRLQDPRRLSPAL